MTSFAEVSKNRSRPAWILRKAFKKCLAGSFEGRAVSAGRVAGRAAFPPCRRVQGGRYCLAAGMRSIHAPFPAKMAEKPRQYCALMFETLSPNSGVDFHVKHANLTIILIDF
jgi:hypothetical protein